MDIADDAQADALIDSFAEMMEMTVTMWVTKAKRSTSGMMFVITDEPTKVAAAVHASSPGSFMLAPREIDSFQLVAILETAFVQTYAPNPPLDPHQGNGQVRVVIMHGGHLSESWVTMDSTLV